MASQRFALRDVPAYHLNRSTERSDMTSGLFPLFCGHVPEGPRPAPPGRSVQRVLNKAASGGKPIFCQFSHICNSTQIK
jgi:hypothetical protein